MTDMSHSIKKVLEGNIPPGGFRGFIRSEAVEHTYDLPRFWFLKDTKWPIE
jgi:hypothetical protein